MQRARRRRECIRSVTASHRPQIILRDITVTRKMERTPDGTKQHNKSVLSVELILEHHMQIPAVQQQLCPIQSQCKVRSLTTRFDLSANYAPLAEALLQTPFVVQRQTSHPQPQQLLAAEDFVRLQLSQEFQSTEPLGLVRDYHVDKP